MTKETSNLRAMIFQDVRRSGGRGLPRLLRRPLRRRRLLRRLRGPGAEGQATPDLCSQPLLLSPQGDLADVAERVHGLVGGRADAHHDQESGEVLRSKLQRKTKIQRVF